MKQVNYSKKVNNMRLIFHIIKPKIKKEEVILQINNIIDPLHGVHIDQQLWVLIDPV